MPSKSRTKKPEEQSMQPLIAKLEQSLGRTISQRFDRLGKDNEARMKKLLDETLSQLSADLMRASLNLPGESSASSRGASGEAKLGSAIGRLINLAVSGALDGKKTKISTAETDRSKQASALKPSKSQQQASAAAQAQKGMRNL